MKIALFLLSIPISCTCYGQALKFASPLHGTQGQDFFITYYVDHDTTKNFSDAFCGNKTYDGHTGTDFSIRSFKSMDSGVCIYAMADGKVLKTRDGLFDRYKHWVGKPNPGNFVGILHGSGYYTEYCHMQKGSLLVKTGDKVKAGQPIGKVGSSGYSSGPHLHIGIRDFRNDVIDPFSAKCQTIDDNLWLVEPKYDTSTFVVEDGFVPYRPNLDTLTERYLVRDTFYMKKDTTVCY